MWVFSFPARLPYFDNYITSFMFVTSYVPVSAALIGSAMVARPAGTGGAGGAAGVRMIEGLLTLSRENGYGSYALEKKLIISLQ